jgi:PII-like signaling protein
MQGYQLTFYTQEGRRHHGKQLSHWLMQVMREMQIRGATHTVAAEESGTTIASIPGTSSN